MMSLKKITVSILGEQYHLVSDKQERDVIQAARAAESLLSELREKAKDRGMSEQHISILALLKLSLNSTLHEKELQDSRDRIGSLITLIDHVLSVKLPLEHML